jgi:hypothetical protein
VVVAEDAGESLSTAGAFVQRECFDLIDGRFRDEQEATDAALGSDGHVRENDQIVDSLIFDGRNDGDISCTLAKSLRTERRKRER